MIILAHLPVCKGMCGVASKKWSLDLHLVSDPRSLPCHENLTLLSNILLFKETSVKHYHGLNFYYCFWYNIGSNTSQILHLILNQRLVTLVWCWRQTWLGCACREGLPNESSRVIQTVCDFSLHVLTWAKLECSPYCVPVPLGVVAVPAVTWGTD